MSQKKDLSDQELMAYAALVLTVLWVVLSLGSLVVIIAAMAMITLKAFRASYITSFVMAFASAFIGMLVNHHLTFWLMEPVYMMHIFYAQALPDSLITLFISPGELTGFMSLLAEHSWQSLKDTSLWILFAPAGIFCGATIYCFLIFFFKNPLGRLKRQKQMDKNHGKVGNLSAIIINQRPADCSEGSLIGVARYARRIELSDRCANQHTLVLGTTGSGKTVTVCNIVESAINRGLLLIYIDGKGDYDLACRVERTAQQRGRPVSVFAMRGDSIAYNPLATGGFTSKKDRIIELREWSEEHYKKLAEGYLQSVFKVMGACSIPCNMVSLSNHLDLKKLKALVVRFSPVVYSLKYSINNS